MMKKLIIAGGTGFLGQALAAFLSHRFEEIAILSRTKISREKNIRYVQWDARTKGEWCQELEHADVIINLCGKSVDCRYTQKNKKEILASRIDSTTIIGECIKDCKYSPALWINAASATIYRYSEQEPMTELNGEIGQGFSEEVCQLWEKTFFSYSKSETRQVNLRIGLVLGMEGGVLPKMYQLTKIGLGGKMGNGKQLVSWIHIEDFCRMVEWIIDYKNQSGDYNCCAPQPCTNYKLMELLRQKARRPIGLPASKWMLELGAFFMRTETELILKSRYVVPEKASHAGFTFHYSDIESALNEIFKK